ncbi:fused response regulator/phosphatase [Pseudomonas abyssi]|jgi:serine phosphatase RsbU (regulator of sigma subunit)|uniref:Fused response regulator/phosphatase n=1 Tax=Pseudomonas abyssi TaxID=170540 RepID=A0A2A3MCH7_9PSED|nr:SpoIIE family protein phosphatase [Pseudomonas abyssi]MAC99710.1 fused response regulator/phosphatase [Pseudomonadales bacterium]PBK02472.1 fused response regulator/phosphatase [Pseudomonas abyssi]|tara:strand:- start:49831 stop:51027 length:1197 start_codon:yes stop_codon:yes gene_type:complete
MQPSGTTLLVIDDDDQVRQRLTAYLEELGCDVLQAATAGDGVALFHDARPELVLCDLHLGNGQGFEVVRQITETGLEVPVIVMCADGAMADAVEALRLGASDFLLNPMHDPEVLSHAVRRALDRARLRLENQRIRERLERANRELEVHLKELRDDQAAGHQVQLNMLPQTPWVSGEYKLEHRLIPSLYLSGDFVDYFRISDSQLGFYLADVSGHGSSSAFVTVLLKFMTTRLMYEQRKTEGRASGRIEFKPSDVLGHINRSLINCKLGKHVTMLGGVIDEQARTLTYSIGGHLPLPVIYTEGQARYLTGKGRPVGLFEDAEYQNETIELPERFSLTLCSDGVLDCLEGSTLKDKEARLPALIAAHGGTMQGIMAALGLDPNKTMPDDISVLVLSRNAE